MERNLLGANGKSSQPPEKRPQHYRVQNAIPDQRSEDSYYSSVTYDDSSTEFSSTHYEVASHHVEGDRQRYTDQPPAVAVSKISRSMKHSLKTFPQHPTSKPQRNQSTLTPGYYSFQTNSVDVNEQQIYANVSTEPGSTFQRGEMPAHTQSRPNNNISQMGVYEFDESRLNDGSAPIRSIDEEDDDDEESNPYSYACVGKLEVSKVATCMMSSCAGFYLEDLLGGKSGGKKVFA